MADEAIQQTQGLFELGDLTGEEGSFVRWDSPLDESIDRIRDVYVANFDDENMWPWFSWLNLTDKGAKVAREIESSSQTSSGI